MSITICILLFVSSAFGAKQSLQNTSAKYIARCSNGTDSNFTFEPANDGVEGRYKVEWCTSGVDNSLRIWELKLTFYNNRPPERCQHFNIRMPQGNAHSYTNINVDFDCTNVCLSTHLDLIFNGTCYHIMSGFRKTGSSQLSSDADHALFYIENKFPKEYFTGRQLLTTHETLQNKEFVGFFTKSVPITDYNAYLCSQNNITGVMEKCQFVGINCTIEKYNLVTCLLQPPPACYIMKLEHTAPWSVAGIFHYVYQYNLCVAKPQLPSIVSETRDALSWAGGALVWAGGAVLLATVGVAALLLLLRARSDRGLTLRHRVLNHWRSSSKTAIPQKPVSAGSRVLLIYARDCPPFARAVDLLATALRRTGCQVIDLFSGEAAAASAAAPGEWVRRLAADPATRLLLLQSPAAALYTAQLRPSATLSAPPVGRVAVRRAPHHADAVAMMALRLLGEAAHRPLAYRKCYVASINGLEMELVPGVTPQRRYVLPAYADVLLRDLAPEAPTSHGSPIDSSEAPTDPSEGTGIPDCSDLLQELTVALQEMKEYVRDNPNYLTDELLYI